MEIKLKKGLADTSSDFWYDLTDGGYLKPEKMCEDLKIAKKIQEAVDLIKSFQDACEEQIEDFIQ